MKRLFSLVGASLMTIAVATAAIEAAAGAKFVLQALASRLQFLAYRVSDLPSPVPGFSRNVLGLPLLTWTVRTPEDQRRAARHADQIIFEGLRP